MYAEITQEDAGAAADAGKDKQEQPTATTTTPPPSPLPSHPPPSATIPATTTYYFNDNKRAYLQAVAVEVAPLVLVGERHHQGEVAYHQLLPCLHALLHHGGELVLRQPRRRPGHLPERRPSTVLLLRLLLGLCFVRGGCVEKLQGRGGVQARSVTQASTHSQKRSGGEQGVVKDEG